MIILFGYWVWLTKTRRAEVEAKERWEWDEMLDEADWVSFSGVSEVATQGGAFSSCIAVLTYSYIRQVVRLRNFVPVILTYSVSTASYTVL